MKAGDDREELLSSAALIRKGCPLTKSWWVPPGRLTIRDMIEMCADGRDKPKKKNRTSELASRSRNHPQLTFPGSVTSPAAGMSRVLGLIGADGAEYCFAAMRRASAHPDHVSRTRRGKLSIAGVPTTDGKIELQGAERDGS
jgi:hypothetical protein